MSSRRRVGTHFVIEEFDCKCGTRVPREHERAILLLTASWLDWLRQEFGAVTVLSGYRTPAYNREIGGATRSVHMLRTKLPNHRGQPMVAAAADVRCARGTPNQWARWARAHRERRGSLQNHGRGGIGTYQRAGFVHLDTAGHRDWSL